MFPEITSGSRARMDFQTQTHHAFMISMNMTNLSNESSGSHQVQGHNLVNQVLFRKISTLENGVCNLNFVMQ